jgi:hypothetical protein
LSTFYSIWLISFKKYYDGILVLLQKNRDLWQPSTKDTLKSIKDRLKLPFPPKTAETSSCQESSLNTNIIVFKIIVN